MGFEDRAYYRNRPPGGGSFLQWLISGSVPLFTAFGIRVRAHSSLVILSVLMLLLGLGDGFSVRDRVVSVTVLFAVILCHEFGHCFGARSVGGEAEDIMMTPLGGLAFTMAPRRPWPTFVTVACGPLVNVAFILISAVILYAMNVRPSWNPWQFYSTSMLANWSNVAWYINWFFRLNYLLLLFNLLPIFPLDGGQLLQSVLWRPMGYFKSMLLAVQIGLVGGILLIGWGLIGGGALMAVIGVSCALTSWSMRAQLLSAGPWAFQEEDADYSASMWRPDSNDKASHSAAAAERREEKAVAKAKKQAMAEAAEQSRIDRILDKVHHSGMNSLSWMEKRTLARATERQRQRKTRA